VGVLKRSEGSRCLRLQGHSVQEVCILNALLLLLLLHCLTLKLMALIVRNVDNYPTNGTASHRRRWTPLREPYMSRLWPFTLSEASLVGLYTAVSNTFDIVSKNRQCKCYSQYRSDQAPRSRGDVGVSGSNYSCNNFDSPLGPEIGLLSDTGTVRRLHSSHSLPVTQIAKVWSI
jgi:hypothetical protein